MWPNKSVMCVSVFMALLNNMLILLMLHNDKACFKLKTMLHAITSFSSLNFNRRMFPWLKTPIIIKKILFSWIWCETVKTASCVFCFLGFLSISSSLYAASPSVSNVCLCGFMWLLIFKQESVRRSLQVVTILLCCVKLPGPETCEAQIWNPKPDQVY